MSSTSEFMHLLNDSAVNVEDDIDPFRDEGDGDEYEEDEDADEELDDDVTEIDEVVFEAGGKKKRAGNYTEVEDVTLIRAWGKVGLDAVTGTDQTGKRYWQQIEDQYYKMKPRTSTLGHRSYRSLQGRLVLVGVRQWIK